MKQLQLQPIPRTTGLEPLEMTATLRRDGSTEVIAGGRQLVIEPVGYGGFVGDVSVVDQGADPGLAPMEAVIGSLMNRFVVNACDYPDSDGSSYEVITYGGDKDTASFDEQDVVDTVRYAVGLDGELDDWSTFNHPRALWAPGKYGWFPTHGKHIGYRGRSSPDGPARIHDDHGGFDTNPDSRHFSLLYNAEVGTEHDLVDAARANGGRAMTERTTAFITKAGIVRGLNEQFDDNLRKLPGMPNGLLDVELLFDFAQNVQAEAFPGAHELGVAPLISRPTRLMARHQGGWSVIYNLPRFGELTNITNKTLEADLVASIHEALHDPTRHHLVPQTKAGSIVGWNGKGVSHRANGNPFRDKASMLWRVTGNHFLGRHFMDETDPRTATMPNPGRQFTETELDYAAGRIAAELF